MSFFITPAFIIGLYSWANWTDIHPWSISAGALSSIIYVFAIYFSYLKSANDSMPINTGITGLTLQIGLIVLTETARRLFGMSMRAKPQVGEEKDTVEETSSFLTYPCRPKWDVPKLTRFGDNALSSQLIWRSMENIKEPLANPWWAFLMFFVISILTPIVPAHQPPLDPKTGILPFAILLIAIKNMPDTFAVDAKKIEEEGIDPDLVELTLNEKNKRTSYDERNILVHRRRSTISKTMEEIQLAIAQAKVEEDDKVTENRRRMSALVIAKPLDGENLEEIVEAQ